MKFSPHCLIVMGLLLSSCAQAAPVQNDAAAKLPDKMKASHILIMYKGSQNAAPTVTRTKAEAKALADDIAKQAAAPQADFAALAKKHSDGPSGPRGGELGNFPPDRMIPEFSRAVAKLKIGGVSAPVESPFGYHIILRQKPDEELNAAHILIMHTKSSRAPESVTRTKEEAIKLAKEVAAKAQKSGADFAALAKEFSDGPSGPGGGDLGVFAPGQMVPAFTKATQALKVGQVSAPVETQFGFHIILRKALPQKFAARHILIAYQGALRASESVTRSKAEALARAQECLKKAQAGEKFQELAGEYSDGPTGVRGGDLGTFSEGQMHPAFEKATKACKVGNITDIVETPFGFHIIQRYK